MHYIIFFRQYLPPTLLLLKGYRKFVSRIQLRCWVLQIAILENDHKISCISCVSLQLSSEQKPLFILIELCFMKRYVWRVSYFSSEHKPLFIPIGLYFIKRHTYGELKCFIKPLTKLETSSTFPNSHQKIL